jgi:hypothetical protein
MLRTLLIAPLLALIASTAPCAIAQDIYKWVDEKGKTHFGDRPPAGAAQTQAITIRDIPEADRNVPSDAQRRAKENLLLERFAEERAEKKQAAVEEKKRRKKLIRQCIQARDQLRRIKRASHLYDLDDAGRQVVRSDEERKKVTRDLEQAIAKNCE